MATHKYVLHTKHLSFPFILNSYLRFVVTRVPTRPGKPGKLRVHLENLEISWNFEKFNKYHGKIP